MRTHGNPVGNGMTQQSIQHRIIPSLQREMTTLFIPHQQPLAFQVPANPTYLVTTPFEIPSTAAICSCESPASSFKRNTSFILRIVIFGAGMLSPDKNLAAYPLGGLYA